MKITINKPKKVFLFILSIIAITIISAILAYLTDKEQKQNEFTIGSIDIKLEETAWDALPDIDNSGVPDAAEAMGPGDTIAKDPKVVNQGQNDAIVYLKVEVPKAEIKVAGGSLERQELFTYTVHGDNWVLMPDLTVEDVDGNKITYIYYYKNGTEDYLREGATSETLFDNVTLKDITNFNGLSLEQQIVVKAYAIQMGDELTVTANPWISKFEEEKNPTPVMQGVRVLSTPSNVGIGWQAGDTIIIGVEYNGPITVTVAPTLTAQVGTGLEFDVTYDGVEIASLEKNQNLAVSSRANESVKTILKYKHIIQDGEVGEFKIKSYTGGELYTVKGKRITVSTMPTIPEAEKVLILEPAGPTVALYSQITGANYGQDVDYKVTSNGITISNWKIFCKEGDVVTIIAKDIIPNSAIPSGAEMTTGTGTTANPCLYRAYWVKQSSDSTGRTNAVNSLLGAYKSGNTDIWKDFVREDITGKATAMGGITVTTFVNSWNTYPGQTQIISIGGNETSGIGLKIGDTAAANSYIQDTEVSSTNKANTLYYPRTAEFQDGTAKGSDGTSGYSKDGKCYGYWMASPSGDSAKYVIRVRYTGRVGYYNYYYAYFGVRPSVRLASDIKGIYRNGKWIIK